MTQLLNVDIGSVIRALLEPLGSLLQSVVSALLADGTRDLVVIPAGPAAVMP